MQGKQSVSTPAAPAAIGPYSQGILAGNFLFASGQTPLDPASGQLVNGTVAEQAEQCLKNIKAVLEAGGTSMEQVVKTTVFLVDMADFAEVNAVYARWFTGVFPARSCVAVKALPKGANVEIEAIALVP